MKIDIRNPAVMAAVAAVVLLVAGPGYYFYSQSVKDTQRKAVAQQVTETTKSLALAISLRGADGEAQQLDAQVEAAERRLAALRGAPGKSVPEVYEAGEQYITDAQRVMRRQAALVRVRIATAGAQNALIAHMGRAENRSDEWIREAVGLRQKLEKEFFEFRAAATAYSSALEAIPASRRQAVAAVPGAAFYDEAALGKVQMRAAEDARSATAELENLKKLPPPR
jgi:hypothetical protein